MSWIAARLLSRPGAVALVVAVLGAGVLVAVHGSTGVLAFPVVLILAWCVAFIWDRAVDDRHPPQASPFTRRGSTSSLRTTLRQDRNAHFVTDNRGFLWRRRVWFEGTGCPPVRVPSGDFARMGVEQFEGPVLVAVSGDRRYWWWEGAFYWENEGYEAMDVKALILRTRRQKERQLQHAHALMAGDTVRRRDTIPEDVRRHVWQRDEGRCQECGSAELLQYDHIIPWSLGGADTAENLRLLCAECNRLKSDAI